MVISKGLLKSYPLVVRFLIFLVIPAVIGIYYVDNYLKASLPTVEGEIVAPGLSAPVTVSRNAQGVPLLQAANDRDVFFAMGFVHAQDRLWQLELQRHVIYGRLSKITGTQTVYRDIWYRTLNLPAAADMAWNALSSQAQDSLIAYAEGVNAWIDSSSELPIEFKFFELQPTRWRPQDSLALMKMLALNLGGNFRKELERLAAIRVLDHESLQVFFPGYPNDSLPIADVVEEVAETSGEVMHSSMLLPEYTGIDLDALGIGTHTAGSNAWVISGNQTADGGAILANDPHLGLTIPSPWYAAEIHGDNIRSSGMTLVGLPIIIFGQNSEIAWGGTNLMADVQDLYLERTNGKNPDEYQVNDGWDQYEQREEIIEVAPKFPAFLRQKLQPLSIKINSTRHGPIISDIFGVENQPLALRWTALDSDDSSYESFFRLNFARNWDEFQEAAALHVAPPLNLLYADINGNIGHLAAGRIPIRSNGWGDNPGVGWTDEYEWIGYIPAAELPRTYNPESGFLVSANNRIVDGDYPYFISFDWASPVRAERISQLVKAAINSGEPLIPEVMRTIQADTLDLSTKNLLEQMVQVEGKSEQEKKAIKLLKNWNGSMEGSSHEASIYYGWYRYLRSYLLYDELQGYWNQSHHSGLIDHLSSEVTADVVANILADDPHGFCDDKSTKKIESCDRILRSSLRHSLWELDQLSGSSSMEKWKWKEIHTTLYTHTPFSQFKLLNSIFQRKAANGGSSNSVNVASSSFKQSRGYIQSFGPSFRQIIQMNPAEILHLYMNSTGQSGNIASDHYDDMVEGLQKVEYYPLNISPHDAHTLRLTPQ